MRLTLNLQAWLNGVAAAILLATLHTIPWWGILAGASLAVGLTPHEGGRRR